MSYAPWWLSGIALAGVMLFHWFSIRRMMAVSGRFTALVNRLRHGEPEPAPEMSQEELLAALAAATGEEFGVDAIPDPEPAPVVEPPAEPLVAPPQTSLHHVLFFVFLVLGGFASAMFAGGYEVTASLRGERFEELLGGSPILRWGSLVLGGVLVGFGTRMSGGCTSGHGLCGLSRFQPGSALATAAFFGAGIATSFLLGLL